MYADLVKEQLPNWSEKQILLEPARRNTAPCIAWAAYHIRALNPNANIVVAPSDHLILKEEEFRAAIIKGLGFVSHSEKSTDIGESNPTDLKPDMAIYKLTNQLAMASTK